MKTSPTSAKRRTLLCPCFLAKSSVMNWTDRCKFRFQVLLNLGGMKIKGIGNNQKSEAGKWSDSQNNRHQLNKTKSSCGACDDQNVNQNRQRTKTWNHHQHKAIMSVWIVENELSNYNQLCVISNQTTVSYTRGHLMKLQSTNSEVEMMIKVNL